MKLNDNNTMMCFRLKSHEYYTSVRYMSIIMSIQKVYIIKKLAVVLLCN